MVVPPTPHSGGTAERRWTPMDARAHRLAAHRPSRSRARPPASHADPDMLTAPHGFEPGDSWAEHGGPDRTTPAVRRLTRAVAAWWSPPRHRRAVPQDLRERTRVSYPQGRAALPRTQVRGLTLGSIMASTSISTSSLGSKRQMKAAKCRPPRSREGARSTHLGAGPGGRLLAPAGRAGGRLSGASTGPHACGAAGRTRTKRRKSNSVTG